MTDDIPNDILLIIKRRKLKLYEKVKDLEEQINNPPTFSDEEFNSLFVDPQETKEDYNRVDYQFKYHGRDLAYEWFLLLPIEEQHARKKEIQKHQSRLLRESLEIELTLANNEYMQVADLLTQIEASALHAKLHTSSYTKEDLTRLKQVPIADLLPEPPTFVSQSRSKARCPFHHEKTPSFTIFHEDNHYFCFGCQEGGDNIKFVMKLKNMTFLEAINHLRRYA